MTIETAGEKTTISTTKTMSTTLTKVNTYPPIEIRRERKRKKRQTRQLPPQGETNTNSSPLPAFSYLPHVDATAQRIVKNERQPLSFTSIEDNKIRTKIIWKDLIGGIG